MKMIVAVALAFVALAVAAPSDKSPETLSSNFEQKPDGSFEFDFRTENGIEQKMTGELKEALDEENKPHTVVVLRGSYLYPSADGTPVKITYVADELGYRAEGESIPKVAART